MLGAQIQLPTYITQILWAKIFSEGWFQNWKGAKCNSKPSVIAVNEIMKYVCCCIVRIKFTSGKVIEYFLRAGAKVPSKSTRVIYEYWLQTNIC